MAVLGRTLPAVRDWEGLRRAALHHGLVGLLCKRAVASGSTAIPAEQREALSALTAANERRSLRMGVQLLGLLELLDREGIEAFSVKGPLMAEALYGDPGLRHSIDLDIAVGPRDLTAACDVLRAAGFQQITGVDIELDRLLASECEVAFKHPDRELVLDLHWRLGPRFAHASLPVADLMAGARKAAFLGRDVLTLSRQDLFVVMCVHGAHNHRWDQLELVAALGAWGAAAAESDWLPLLERAAGLGCLRRCTIGCLLMRDLTGCALPVDIESRLARDTLAARLADAARAAMFAEGLETSPTDGLGGIVWESLALDKPALMAAHFVARLFTPGTWDWEFGRMPRHLPRLYYLARPLRLVLGRFGREGSK